MKPIQIHVERCRGSWCLRSTHGRLGAIEGFTSRSQAIQHAFAIVESMHSHERRSIEVVIDEDEPGGHRWAA